MDNDTAKFITENKGTITILPMDGGLIIRIFPAGSLPGQPVYDMFDIGLRKSNLKLLLRALRKGEKYYTQYYQNAIWQDKAGKIHFHNTTNLRDVPEYNCILGVEQSAEFTLAIEYYVNGLPGELSHYTDIQDEYVQHYLKKVVENPSLLKSPKYWDDLGMALGTTGYVEYAMECFYKALELDPEYHIAKLNLVANLDALGKTTEALDLMNQVPDGVCRRNVIMANSLRSAGRALDAIPYYEKAIYEEPDFFLPYLSLLRILFENNHPLFEFWLEKALENHRDVPTIDWFYTDLLLKQQRIEELAEIDWLDDLKNTPTDLGIIGRNEDDPYFIAIAQLNQTIGLIFRDGDGELVSSAISQLGEIPIEWNLCTQAKMLVSAAIQSGQPELISSAYERICPTCIENENGVARFLDTMLARGYQEAGDWENALVCCERVLTVDPKHKETLNTYYWNLDNVGRLDDAITAAENLYALDPSVSCLCYNLGYFHGRNGRLGKAEFYYRRQLEIEPEHWVALENLSFIYLLAAKLDQAKETFERYLELRHEEARLEAPYLDEILTQFVEGLLQSKQEKFAKLLSAAQELLGNDTYAFQLQQLNMADESIIGSQTRIEHNPYSMDNIWMMMDSGIQANVHEAQFERAVQQRGDYSFLMAELFSSMPGFHNLPPEARSSLIEGERRLKDTNNGDFSMVVVAFSKAVEVCIRKRLKDVIFRIADFSEAPLHL
jgi:tetratricopeptide (TPR) repeat protein